MAKRWPYVRGFASEHRSLHAMLRDAFGINYATDVPDLLQAIIGAGFATAINGDAITLQSLYFTPYFKNVEDEKTFANVWNAAVDEHARRRANGAPSEQ